MSTVTGDRSRQGAGDEDRPSLIARLPAGASRRTVPTRGRGTRSWGLVTLAALLVLGTGLAVAAWGLHAGDRVSVLALADAVSKGSPVERADLVSEPVAGVANAVPVADIETVVGRRAATDLVPGQLLLPSMLTDRVVPGVGEATVGLALDPNRAPTLGLDPGDHVDVVAVPAPDGVDSTAALDAPEVLAARAEVVGSDGTDSATGQLLVILVVASKDAARVASYSTQGRVAIVEMGASSEVPTTSEGGGS